MKTYSTCLFISVLLAPLLLINCVSYSSYQTARTLPTGKVSGSAGLGYNYLGDESFVDIALRAGLGDSIDIGAKFNYTGFGSAHFMLDMKKEMSNKLPNFHTAVGVGLSSVMADDLGLAVHLPVYFSFHSPNQKLTLYLNPRAFYYLDLRDELEREFNNSSLAAGNTVGLKLGNKFSIMPEYSFFVGKHDDEVKLNTLFSVGLGFNVR